MGPIQEAADAPVRVDDSTALAALYRAQFDRFVRVAAGITGELDSAYEAVQDAFADVLAARAPARDERLAGYVWRAVVNASHDARRRASVRVRREGAPGEELAAPQVPPVDRATRAAVAALPERQRLVLFLRYYADLDYEGIAQAAGIRRGTVGLTLLAAERSLRRALGEEER